ncbi:MAG: hypothetical protein N2485_01455 [bacterium]|nr:hypothetical protein [bacterium]
MKRRELFLIIIILILLAFSWFYFIYNIKRKQLISIQKEKIKIQEEIRILSNNKIELPKEINNSNYEKLLTFIRRYNLAEINQVKNLDNNITINLVLSNEENLLNILDYIYKNQDFLKINALDITLNEEQNNLLVNLTLINLYLPPNIEVINNYSFNLKFFNEKYYLNKIKEQIELEKQIKYQEKQKELTELKKLELITKDNIYNQSFESNINNNDIPTLNIIYKGTIFINNEKYGVLAMDEKEYFLKENQTIIINQNKIKILNIQKQSIKILLNDSNILELKLNIL